MQNKIACWMLFLYFIAPYFVYGELSASMDCNDPCTVSAGSKIQVQWNDAPAGEKISVILGWRNSKTQGIRIVDVAAMDDVDGAVGSGTVSIYNAAPPGEYYYLLFMPSKTYSQQRTLGPFTITGGDASVSLINQPSTFKVELFCFEPCVGGSTPVYSGDWLRLHVSGIPSDIGPVDIWLYWGNSGVEPLLLDTPVNETMFVLLPWDDKAPPGGSYHVVLTQPGGYGYQTSSLPFELSNDVITSNPGYTPPPPQQILTHIDHVPEHLKAKPSQEGTAATIRTTIYPILFAASITIILAC